MEQHDTISNLFSKLSYLISGYLVVGDWLTFIDHHTWIVGAALGLLTWITNVYFKIKSIRNKTNA
ncbi:MAG: hypothetical protein ACXWE9_00915 [Methylobacter sp.]